MRHTLVCREGGRHVSRGQGSPSRQSWYGAPAQIVRFLPRVVGRGGVVVYSLAGRPWRPRCTLVVTGMVPPPRRLKAQYVRLCLACWR